MCAPKFCELSLQTSRCSNKAWKVCGRFKPSQCGKYMARKSPGGGGFARTCQSSASAPEIDDVSLKISFSSVLDSVSMTFSGAVRRGAGTGPRNAWAVAHRPTSRRGSAIVQNWIDVGLDRVTRRYIGPTVVSRRRRCKLTLCCSEAQMQPESVHFRCHGLSRSQATPGRVRGRVSLASRTERPNSQTATANVASAL